MARRPTAKRSNYLERNLVEQAGVDIEFFHYENPKYRQLHPGFVQRLSALDAMMNCGRQTAALIEWSTPHACDGSRRPPG